jgi:DNA mismatch repair protein MutL
LEEAAGGEEITVQSTLGGGALEEFDFVEAPEGSQVPRMRPLGQVHDTYIIAETAEGMLVIDQHAAAERVNLERIMERMESGEVLKQELITPVEIELGPKEANILLDNREVLESVGFEVEEFGPNTVLVRSLPVVLGRLAEREMITEILEEIADLGSSKAMTEFRDSVAHIVACKGAIKAGDTLTKGQIEDLVRGLYSAKRPYSCAHGRPTILSLTKTELEKRFKRTV